MKTPGVIFLVSLLFAVSLFAVQGSFNRNGGGYSYRGTGGPDDYGYIWIDSDEPGGPAYNWIDITGVGTEVTGLFDDNNVGPFSIGFDFPYYWYLVNQFWVNSNGAISFSDAGVYTPQGGSGYLIPSVQAPNDLVIPLGADLIFEGIDSSACYYYSNNVDTFIVSFINVGGWNIGGPEGAHDFQIIMTRADSCIYFMYGDQSGQFYLSGDCGGIENVIGNDGLQVFYNLPPNSLQDYAVLFIPPDSTNYQALDIGVKNAFSEGSKCVFMFPGDDYSLSADIINVGNVDAGPFEVRCTVWDTAYTTQFTDTITVSGLVAGAETTLYFTPTWSPPQVDNYLAFIQTQLSGDINPSNNTKDVELQAINLPGWLMYDSDPSSGMASYWYTAGSGWGQEFNPPQYPITIDSILVTVSSPVGCQMPVLFMDDDGPGGLPGTILHSDTIYVPAGSGFNYYKMSIPAGPGTITSGKFYGGFIQVGDSFPLMIVEDTGPFSRCAYEYTGSWAPYRSKDEGELLIRAYSSSMQGVSEEVGGRNYALSLLPARPNPVRDAATIYFALPRAAHVTLKLYDLTGRELRTLVNEKRAAGLYTARLDASELPQGVYFYQLTTGDRSLTRKITVLH
jgi:hypothetical protein